MLAVLEGEHLAGSGKREVGSERRNGEQRDTEREGREAVGGVRAVVPDQLGLFSARVNPVVEKLEAVDVNALTPLEALNLLATLAAEAKRSH
jgi:hypothetical protein